MEQAQVICVLHSKAHTVRGHGPLPVGVPRVSTAKHLCRCVAALSGAAPPAGRAQGIQPPLMSHGAPCGAQQHGAALPAPGDVVGPPVGHALLQVGLGGQGVLSPVYVGALQVSKGRAGVGNTGVLDLLLWGMARVQLAAPTSVYTHTHSPTHPHTHTHTHTHTCLLCLPCPRHRLGGINGAFFNQGWGDLCCVNLREDLEVISTWPPQPQPLGLQWRLLERSTWRGINFRHFEGTFRCAAVVQ